MRAVGAGSHALGAVFVRSGILVTCIVSFVCTAVGRGSSGTTFVGEWWHGITLYGETLMPTAFVTLLIDAWSGVACSGFNEVGASGPTRGATGNGATGGCSGDD